MHFEELQSTRAFSGMPKAAASGNGCQSLKDKRTGNISVATAISYEFDETVAHVEVDVAGGDDGRTFRACLCRWSGGSGG